MIVRIAAAKDLLAEHHSAQLRQDGDQSSSMYKHVPFIKDVPRGISKGVRPWSCHCGELDNWLCRPRCKACGREQPAHIAANARKVAERVRSERGGGRSPSREPSRGRSRERRGRDRQSGRGNGGGGGKGGGGRSGGGGGGSGGGGGGGGDGNVSGSSYADIARRTDELRKQLASEKKEREALARKLAAATSSKTGDGNDGDAHNAASDDSADDDANADAARDLRLQQLQNAIEALEAVVDSEDSKLVALRAEKDGIVKARREGKPLKIQLLALDRRLGKKRDALKRAEGRCSEAWAAAERTRKEAEEADKEHADIANEIDTLENEKRDILRRELEGEDGSRADDVHWEGTVDAIRTRIHLPGVDSALATTIAATLETLRLQCLQLPATVPPAVKAGTSAGIGVDGAAVPPAKASAPATTPTATHQVPKQPLPATPVVPAGPPASSPVVAPVTSAILAPHAKASTGAKSSPATPPTAKAGGNGAASQAAAVLVPNADADKDLHVEQADEEMSEADVLLRKLPERNREQLSELFRRRFEAERGGQRDRERSPRREEEDRNL